MSSVERMLEARRVQRDAAIWGSVERVREREHCRCELREGMTREQLPTGSGCREDYVCPALDTYRRLLPPTEISDEERALQESA